MADFLIKTEINEKTLHIWARRADGEIKDFYVPMQWVRQAQRFSVIKELIPYLTGEETHAGV